METLTNAAEKACNLFLLNSLGSMFASRENDSGFHRFIDNFEMHWICEKPLLPDKKTATVNTQI